MPYVKDIFYDKVAPYADIVEVTSNSFEELEQDFDTKYAGVKAIYRCRAPGSIWGNLGEEFFKRLPYSCKVVSHRESESRSCADQQSGQATMISMSQQQRSTISR
jgi:hypothetical protein